RRLARLSLGGAEQIKQSVADHRGLPFLDSLWQDVRYGARMLRKSPGFAIVAVLTLALGIGANSALFSVVNGVLLNPLPYPHPGEIITLHESKPNFRTGSISYPNFLDWQRENQTLSSMAVARPSSFNLTNLGDAEQVKAQFVTRDFFSILGVQPLAGRLFVSADDRVGAAPVALISAGFWKHKFGAAQDVIGKILTLDGKGFTVVGVIPPDFDFTLGAFTPSEVYVPVVQWKNNLLFDRGAGLGFHGIGRLKPGVTIDQATSDFAKITRNLAAAYPEVDKDVGATLVPLKDRMVGGVKTSLLVLFCAVGFVLLIACVNIANLLLARSSGRSHEFAVRSALGAGKSRLIRQLLTESVMLGLAGGALGLLIADWGTRAALAALPDALPRSNEVGLDGRVLAFTAAIAILAGILFGLIPAWRLARTNLQGSLKEGGRGSSASRHLTHSALVVAEVALALVLLVGAGLMLRSLVRLWTADAGFNPRNVMTFGLSLPPSMLHESPAAIRAAFRQVDSSLASLPGIQSVSMSWGAFPMDGDDEWLFWMEGQPKPATRSEMKWTLEYVVDPGYLNVMRVPLRSGRFFTAQDDEHSPHVVLVDDIFVRQYFGGLNPVGKRLNLETGDATDQAEIIGVVSHVKQWGLASDDTEPLRAQLYFPFMQLPDVVMALAPTGMRVVVRTSASSTGAFDSIRHTLQQVNSENVVYEPETMQQLMSASIATRRFSLILLGTFAALALLLSSLGIYGVISYLVGRQQREIGIRLALGAQRADILRLILGNGARMALLGVAVGLAASWGLTRQMANLLYGVSATDPLTFALVAIALISVALAACYIPARRAMRVDPVVTLRYE
ncbi:MAG TPA: ABC transporter permease, partial [Candidatus Acidoferrales bacterium]|nr:ABC transporter permease [Candidatus Acidoferrales bacterium]